MSVHSMTPAGWLSGQDLVYRVADAMHEAAKASGRPPLSADDAARAAVATLGMALSLPRPPLAAFIRQRGEWFMVPSHLWARAVDTHAEDAPSTLDAALFEPTLPAAFAPYAGQVGLYGADNVADFVTRLRDATKEPAAPPSPRDPERPWRDFRSLSAWLSSQRATAFIDARLAEAGNLAPRAIDRDRALFKYLKEQGETIEFESIQSRRRPSRMTE